MGLKPNPPADHTCDLLFIEFWLCWVFLFVRGLSPVLASGGSSLVAVCGILVAVASLAVSISSREHRLQGLWASVFAALGLQSTGLCVQT